MRRAGGQAGGQARFFPASEADMLQITGVGETKLARYGKTFIDAIMVPLRNAVDRAPAPRRFSRQEIET